MIICIKCKVVIDDLLSSTKEIRCNKCLKEKFREALDKANRKTYKFLK